MGASTAPGGLGSARRAARPAAGLDGGTWTPTSASRSPSFLVATFPATWLLMLFLGNVGVHVGYWGTLPLGILVSALLGGLGSYRVD